MEVFYAYIWGLIKVITDFTSALDVLDKYDNASLGIEFDGSYWHKDKMQIMIMYKQNTRKVKKIEKYL
jgi:hypothetical protein